MKKEIRVLNKDKSIIQITTLDERWYLINCVYYKSISWVSGMYPKGVQFYKWLASKGWNEAETIKNEAGERGSNVHDAIDKLNKGEELEHDLYSLEEWQAILSYYDWFKTVNPKIIKTETTVYSDKYNIAGTIDIVCEIEGELWIIDLKTSQSIWKEYELQVSAYKKAYEEMNKTKDVKIAILQVGYNLNKKKYKFTELEDKFDLFKSALSIWEEENPTARPRQFEMPNKIKL